MEKKPCSRQGRASAAATAEASAERSTSGATSMTGRRSTRPRYGPRPRGAGGLSGDRVVGRGPWPLGGQLLRSQEAVAVGQQLGDLAPEIGRASCRERVCQYV